jgi:hypothetical protein
MELTGSLSASSVMSHTSVEAVLQPVKLFECFLGSRFAVQPLCLD